jgi:hypothetical protein
MGWSKFPSAGIAPSPALARERRELNASLYASWHDHSPSQSRQNIRPSTWPKSRAASCRIWHAVHLTHQCELPQIFQFWR